jgi:hypothetical protein
MMLTSLSKSDVTSVHMLAIYWRCCDQETWNMEIIKQKQTNLKVHDKNTYRHIYNNKFNSSSDLILMGEGL